MENTMAAVVPIVLILGAGSNVGAGVARAFAQKGYKTVTASRSPQAKTEGVSDLHVQIDLSMASSVPGVFEKVRNIFGAPSVVVYNATAMTPNPPNDPLSLSVKDLEHALAVTTISVLAAAHEATIAFDSLPVTASRTFIYTGNRLNIAPIAPLLSLGMGKSATAHLIESASGAYKERGYNFYYADERKPDGSPGFGISGEAHGNFYLQLAEKEIQAPWLATFVKGTGYVDFSKSES